MSQHRRTSARTRLVASVVSSLSTAPARLRRRPALGTAGRAGAAATGLSALLGVVLLTSQVGGSASSVRPASADAAPAVLPVAALPSDDGALASALPLDVPTPAPTTEAPAPAPTTEAPTPASRGGGRSDLSGTPQEYARDLLAQRGYASGQFDCLNALWSRESGWQVGATNASSGAYGIPQSLPGYKMADYGSDWQTNPATQIRWGVDYIAQRYGSPCGANSHSLAYGYY